MGKRGGWFSAVRKALSPAEYKEKKDQRPSRKSSKKRWFGRQSHADLVPYDEEMGLPISAPPPPPPLPPPPPPPSVGDLKVVSHVEDEQSKHAYSVALATAVAAEAAVAAAQAAAEVIRLTSLSRFSGRSREETAAIKIQTAFRGYMAKRALKALKGLVRLKNLIQGQSVKRQATTTLQCMQTLARVQSQIRARRIRMSEENRSLHRQMEQQQEKELEKVKAVPKEKVQFLLGDEWNDSTKSREQVEKRLQYRQEAAMRRERALAYAFSHQKALRNLRTPNPTVLDPINPAWGWSWLERWMDARPWETTSASECIDRASIKSTASRAMSIREATPSYSSRPSPTAQKPRRPQTFSPSPSNPPSVASRTRPCSPKGVNRDGRDEDLRSTLSTRTEQPYFRRHSIGGASLRDDDSLASSPQVPNYMAPTKATNARSRLPSPLGLERNASASASEKGSAVPSPSAKKRLSLGSPTGPRRHSGPPKIDIGSKNDARNRT